MKIFLFFLLSLFLFAQSDDRPTHNIDAGYINYNSFVSNTNLPDTLYLCNELVDLTDPELRERAEREYLLLMQQTGQILLYLKRSQRYFPMYDSYLERLNLPSDLKYVSVAESALYMSRSSAGAVGLWQVMPATAKEMGLRVDKFVDERRHPEKSTMIGLQYLAEGYNKFGTWSLAMASYNRGKYGIANDVEFQMKDNYFDLYLNEETSRYYFRILIIKEMMENPERYGFDVSNLRGYSDPETKEVTVNSGISNMAKWAKEQGTDYKTVKLLNPWILKRELNSPGRDKYKIRVPK